MGSQRKIQVRGLGTVTVIDTESASRHLETMTFNFRRGKETPMVFGDAPDLEPEAVVLPFREWMRLLVALADAQPDEEMIELVRSRIANSSPQNASTLEDLGIDLDDERPDD